MKKSRTFLFIFWRISTALAVALLFTLNTSPAHAAGIRYAKPNPSGAGNCSSWADACTLQTALAGASSSDEIWVAAGTHKPTSGTDRYATFQLKSSVTVYGGFGGITETLRTQRNPAVNLTILSGDIDNNDSQTPIITDLSTVTGNSTNSYHVVTGAAYATLDGFTITAGNTTGSPSNTNGGGLFNGGSNLTLTNITFRGNLADRGGGLSSNAYDLTLTSTTFNGNSAGTDGGGIYLDSSGSAALTNVAFSYNTAGQRGGGMFNLGAINPFTQVTFDHNSASEGGGIYNIASSGVTLTNATFRSNQATIGGGVYDAKGGINYLHVTISNNSATSTGGGIYSMTASQIYNVIIWGNTPNGFSRFPSGKIILAVRSILQDGCPEAPSVCQDILTTDPKLGALGNYGGYAQTMPLMLNSPAINVGSDCSLGSDQRGIPYVGTCDIGAYEYDYKGAYFAKPAASGAANCESWANACAMQTALTDVASGQVWAMEGTYKPTTGSDRTATFQLKNGIAVYGGFAGTETSLSQRDPATHVSQLSGDLNGNDNSNIAYNEPTRSDNAYHVVTGASGARLDGFTITGGNANGSGCPGTACGGGMLNSSSNPTLANLIFDRNSASSWGGGLANCTSNPVLNNVTFSNNSVGWEGGGMSNHSSTPTLTNVTFIGNRTIDSGSSGGGMANINSSNLTMTDASFSGNVAVNGAGIYNYQSAPALTNVTISSNTATGYGGGIYNKTSSNPTLLNVTFSENNAYEGGGMHDASSSPQLTNVTFSGNDATSGSGGGMYNNSSNSQLTNVTFSGNNATSGGGMYNFGSSPTLVNVIVANSTGGGDCVNGSGSLNAASSNNLIEDASNACGLVNGSNGNITGVDPNLGTLGNYGGAVPTIPLLTGSRAINAGKTTSVAADARGVTRPQGSAYDIGAYEAVVFTISGNTSAPGTTIDYTGGSTTADGNGDYSFIVVEGWSGTVTPSKSHYTFTPASRNYTNVTANLPDQDFASAIDPAWVRYATEGGAGLRNCSSWSNACTLQTALMGAVSGNEIWVGMGTHKPSASDRAETFALPMDVSVYGGFAMTETLRSQRNPAKNVTILSGDIGTVDNNSDNSYHVVTGANNAVLDGFTITGGNANGTNPDDKVGGGMYNYQSSPTVTNVTFQSNTASSTDGHGGGMRNYQSNPRLTNVTFSQNTARWGGGMHNYQSNPILTNVTFWYNKGSDNGGGLGNEQSSPTLTNVTFRSNNAPYGSAMDNYSNCFPQIRNAIVWENQSNDGTQIRDYVGSRSGISDSILQNGCPAGSTCTNIITADPRLGAPGSYGGSTPTIPLQFNSPAIDAASACPGYDQRNRPRADWQCDIGAFELQYTDSPSVTKSIPGAGTYTFGPTMVKVVVNTPACLTGLTIQRYNANHPNATPALQTGHWWQITPVPSGCTSGFNVYLTLPTDFVPDAKDKVCRWTGTSWDCDADDFATSGILNITRYDVTGFSDWAVGDDAGPTVSGLVHLAARSAPLAIPWWMASLAGIALAALVIRRMKRA